MTYGSYEFGYGEGSSPVVPPDGGGGVGTLAESYFQGDWQAGVGFTDSTFGDLGSPEIVGTFTGTTVADVGPIIDEYHPGNRLMRHFRSQVRGVDLWIYTIPSEVEPLWTVGIKQPGQPIAVDYYRRGNTDFGLPTYWRILHGGCAEAVNAIEAASLIAAGYTLDGPAPPTSTWSTWNQAGIVWNASGITWE